MKVFEVIGEVLGSGNVDAGRELIKREENEVVD